MLVAGQITRPPTISRSYSYSSSAAVAAASLPLPLAAGPPPSWSDTRVSRRMAVPAGCVLLWTGARRRTRPGRVPRPPVIEQHHYEPYDFGGSSNFFGSDHRISGGRSSVILRPLLRAGVLR